MGDAEHLLMFGNGAQLFGHFLCRSAGDTGIHLVEDQGIHMIPLRQNVLHGQHDTCQLTAGGHLAHGLQGFAGVGGASDNGT